MKHLSTFEGFLNESLSAGPKAKVAEVKKLIELAKKKDEDFAAEFDQVYGSAIEMWMGEKDITRLMGMYASGKYDWMELGGEDDNGADDSKLRQYTEKGWKVLADEQNFDSYDCILYKEKK